MTQPDAPIVASAGDVIVFDGVCVLCSGWVHVLLRVDRDARYCFAAMQTASGRALLTRHGLDPDDPVSFLLATPDRAWTDSDAILRVLTGLGGAWRLFGVLRVIPRAVRDPLYRFVARNRYRWFGRRDVCVMPTADEAARFLP